jgi:hypothetical protein
MRLQIAIPEDHVSEAPLNGALEAVTRLNESLIRSGQVPTFEQALANGIKWRPEPPGDERFDHAGIVMSRGWGDCDDLAPYKAASDRVTGKDRNAQAIVQRSGPALWHAVEQRGDGSIDDPSAMAGMPKKGAAVAGHGSHVVGIGPAVVSPMWRTNRPAVAVLASKRGQSVVGWSARADLPWGRNGHALAVTAQAPHPRLAIHEAIAGVCCLGTVCGGNGYSGVDLVSVGKLYALDGLLQGMQPVDIYQQLAPQGFGPLLQNNATGESLVGPARAIQQAGC